MISKFHKTLILIFLISCLLFFCKTIYNLQSKTTPKTLPLFTPKPSIEIIKYLTAKYNYTGTHPLKYNLVIATQVMNQSQYLQEWIEHHRLVGVDRIVIYNDIRIPNSDSLKMRIIANPWIKQGLVEWINWPEDVNMLDKPPFGPRLWNDDKLDFQKFNYTLFGECLLEDDLEWHKHSKCQRAAFMDVFARYRDRSKWIGVFDIDEFMFIPLEKNRIITDESQIPSLQTGLSNYQKNDQLRILGRIYGTNGYFEDPVSKNLDYTFPLVTSLYKYHMNYSAIPKSKFLEGYNSAEKSFCKPTHVVSHAIHNCEFNKGFHDDTIRTANSVIVMNHYQYRSIRGTYNKASANTNWDAVYQFNRDVYLNQVPDNEIDYITPFIKNALENKFKRGEWSDLKLLSNHENSEKPISVEKDRSPTLSLVFIQSNSQSTIPRLRKAVHSIRYYLSRAEPNITFETVMILSDAKYVGPAQEDLFLFVHDELNIDKVEFVNYKSKSKSEILKMAYTDLCSGQYVVNMEDIWEARMGNWFEQNILSIGISQDLILDNVISASISLLENTPKIMEVLLGDTIKDNNSVSDWKTISREGLPKLYEEVNYNSLPETNRIGGSIIHRGKFLSVYKILGKYTFMDQTSFQIQANLLGFKSVRLCLSKIGHSNILQGNITDCSVDPESIGDGSITGIFWSQDKIS